MSSEKNDLTVAAVDASALATSNGAGTVAVGRGSDATTVPGSPAVSSASASTADNMHTEGCSDGGRPGAALRLRVALLLDFHYVEVANKQHALGTTWDVGSFEAQLLAFAFPLTPTPAPPEAAAGSDTRPTAATGTATSTAGASGVDVCMRVAVDSPVSANTATAASAGCIVSAGKAALHMRLAAAGYKLVTPRNKRAGKTAGQQGGTDVALTTALFDAAGAFGLRGDAPADVVVLCAGDSDFRPAIEYVSAARAGMGKPLRVVVVSRDCSTSSDYAQWLQATDGCEHVLLDEIQGAMAQHVVDLDREKAPRGASTVTGQHGEF